MLEIFFVLGLEFFNGSFQLFDLRRLHILIFYFGPRTSHEQLSFGGRPGSLAPFVPSPVLHDKYILL